MARKLDLPDSAIVAFFLSVLSPDLKCAILYYNYSDPEILMMNALRIRKEKKEEVVAAYAKSHLTQDAKDDPRYAELADEKRHKPNPTGASFSNRES
jgi:hypothetical protein